MAVTENVQPIIQMVIKEINPFLKYLGLTGALLGVFYTLFQWGEKSASNKYKGKISVLEKEKDLFKLKYESQEALLNLETKEKQLKNEEEKNQYLARAQNAEKTLAYFQTNLSDSPVATSKIKHFQGELESDIHSITSAYIPSTQTINVSGTADVINNSLLAAIYEKGIDGKWSVAGV